MADLYGRSSQPFGGALAADSAIMFFNFNNQGARDDIGLLIQQMTVNYSQPVNRIYELVSNYVYYVAGRPRGEGQIGSVVGPVGLATEFMRTYGDVCNSATNVLTIDFATNCKNWNTDPPVPYYGAGFQRGGRIFVNKQQMVLNGVIVTNVGLSVRAEDMIFNQATNFIFSSMDINPVAVRNLGGGFFNPGGPAPG